MRDAGVELVANMTGGGTIGVAATVMTAPHIVSRYFRLRGELLSRRPDVFVPIDFGAFNTRLAQIARKHGVEVVYYFPPSSWRRRPRNAERLIACGGKVITPFPWSAQLLSEAGVDARFVGHPLIDVVRASQDKRQFLRDLELSESLPTVGLLPGSRSHELAEHLPPMLACARIMHRELGGAQFVVAAAPGRAGRIRERVKSESASSDFPVVRIVEGHAYDCMAHSDFLIATSGTATLEAAILGTPMLIIYRGTAIMRWEYEMRKSSLEDYIGMPNIIADRGVCPELLNEDVTAEKLADVALGLMNDGDAIARMRSELAGVRERLGEAGAVERAARTLLDMGGLT